MKIPALFAIVPFVLCSALANAQTTIKYYGHDTSYSYQATDIIEVSTGGYLISGYVYWAAPLIENSYHHRYYVRTDSNGDTLWTRYFAHDVFGEGDIMEKPNGDFFAFGVNGGSYLCGFIGATWPNGDYYLESLSAAGSQLSYNQYSDTCGDNLLDITKSPGGGLTAFMNFSVGPFIGAQDIYKIKEVNANGIITNSITLNGNVQNDFAIEKASNGYWLAASNRLDKISNNGSIIWTKPITFSPFLADFCKVTNDSLVFACSKNDGAYPDTSTVVKTDSSGNVGWVKHFHAIRAFHIMQHSSGNYILTGRDSADVVVLALNSNGDSLWCNKFTLTVSGAGVKSIENSAGDIVTLASTNGWGVRNQYVMILQTGMILTPFAPTNLHASPVLKMPQGDRIQLDWTDNAGNEDGFLIQRSLDGVSGWATIDSAGENITGYLDEGLTSGAHYFYRVAAFNGYGLSAFSNTSSATTFTSVADLLAKQIRIFPNPNDGMFTIAADASIIADLYFEIVDAVGQTIFLPSVSNGSAQFDLKEFGKGIYFLKIKMQEDVISVRKVITY